MQTISDVDSFLAAIKAEQYTAPEIILALAPQCIGWPYVFGSWGEECTPANRKRRVRDDHPTIKSACVVLQSGGSCSQCKWGCGVRMYDCRGFTAWLLRQAGLDLTGGGATSQYNYAPNWAQRGEISQMPDVVCCVFRQVAGRMEHTGMHIGHGRVIHCSHNVEECTIKSGKWTHYAIPAGLYSEEEIPASTTRRTLRRGSTGEDVKELQTRLASWGYLPGKIDGIYGKQTEAAVKAFQTANGLAADGICGQQTWAAVLQPVETYTVRAEGVTYQQYRRILDIVPTAEVTKEVRL